MRRTTILATAASALCIAQTARAAEQGTSRAGLHTVDWLLVGVYALLTIWIGWYFGRQQRGAREYFLGRGDMNPWLVGVSLFATLTSTISYLSMPGEALGKGPGMLATIAALPLVYLVVAYVLIPVYMQQRVTSAYELLEAKLGVGIRLLGACLFLVLRLVWMALLIHLSAKALAVMAGLPPEWIPVIVLFTGLVAVVYTSIGGLRAVVVTDFFQTILLFGGALLVIATVTARLDGWQWIPTSWHPHWDDQPFFSWDPQTRVSTVGTIVSMFVWFVCTAGGDQTAVQRYMATTDVAAARRAAAAHLGVSAIVTLTLFLVGMALLGYVTARPDELPTQMTREAAADFVFPWYISNRLPIGISGLVVSAMFAAAMSSIDSGINSITAVVTTDFLGRFRRRPITDRHQLVLSRCIAVAVGAIVVTCSSLMGYVPGNIMAVTNKTANLLTTPIFGLFFFALFVPFARPLGVLIGTVCCTIVAAAIAFSGPLVTYLDQRLGIPAETFGVSLRTSTDPITGFDTLVADDPISFQWIGPVALATCLATGTVASWLLGQWAPRTRNP